MVMKKKKQYFDRLCVLSFVFCIFSQSSPRHCGPLVPCLCSFASQNTPTNTSTQQPGTTFYCCSRRVCSVGLNEVIFYAMGINGGSDEVGQKEEAPSADPQYYPR